MKCCRIHPSHIVSHFSPPLSILHTVPAVPKDLEPLGFTLCFPDSALPQAIFLSWNTFFLFVTWRTPPYPSCLLLLSHFSYVRLCATP